MCCCHLVAKEDKTRSFCPLGQSGVWLKVNGSSNPAANLLKQQCNVKEAASAGEEPPPFPPSSCPSPLLPASFLPFWSGFLFFLFLHSTSTPTQQHHGGKPRFVGLLLCTVSCSKHLHVLTHLILIKAQLGRSHHPHFAGRETGSERLSHAVWFQCLCSKQLPSVAPM